MAQVTTLCDEPQSAVSIGLELAPPVPHRGIILVVDDCDDVRLGLAQLLELYGFRVLDAADAEHAMEQLTAAPRAFALVLLDLMLPGLSGAELRARQLADPQLAAIPTVVITVCELASAPAMLKPAAWLEKPFRCHQLLDVVRRYVTPEASLPDDAAY